MNPIEPDVFICYRDSSCLGVAGILASGLMGLGFVVAPFECRGSASAVDDRRKAIEEAPDFILVLDGPALDGFASPTDPLRLELAHALRHRRIVVPVCLPGVSIPSAADLPDDIRALSARQPVRFDPEKVRQSVALVAHSLSSDAEVVDRKLMDRARVAAGIVALIFVGVVASFVVPAVYRLATAPKPKPPLPPFSLSWAAFGQRTIDGSPAAFEVTERAIVLTGDRITLVFSPSASGSAYVIAKNARGEVSVLFPPHTLRGASRVEAGTMYEVPAGRAWLAIGADEVPMDLFLIGSYDPLENLEELIEEPDARTTAAERADLLDSTVAGLMDGRHAAGVRYAKTRGGNTIDPRLDTPPGIRSGRTTLDDGTVLDRQLTSVRGAISAAVEIRIRRQS